MNTTHPVSQGTCLGLDFGRRRIGVAVGEARLQTARPLSVVRNLDGTPDWQALNRLVEDWRPELLIVGWPLTESGEEQSITKQVGRFIEELEQLYQLPVRKEDERFSSNAAQRRLKDMRQSGQRRRKVRHEDIDSVAAAVILESWFSSHV